jgi:enoyl-CoA hydratase/carnithine racemase
VALKGAVVGGGFELAAAAHLRVADETAFFGLPEGTRGIFVGGGGSVRIARLIGAARMGDMMLTGRTVSPVQMEQWGGVSYVVPEGQALDKAIALARVAAQNAPMSNYAILNALPRIRDMSSEDGLFTESLMSALTSATPEATQRLRDFLEKRTAKLSAPEE